MAKTKLKNVKIRLTKDKLEALKCICDDMLKEFKPETDIEVMMLEYLKELSHQINNRMKLDQNLFTLHLTGTEALSFKQLWEVLPIKNDRYASILIKSIISNIDTYISKI